MAGKVLRVDSGTSRNHQLDAADKIWKILVLRILEFAFAIFYR